MNKGLERLFKIPEDPKWFAFSLPELVPDEPTVEITVTQLKRFASIITILNELHCKYQEIKVYTDQNQVSEIEFLILNNIEQLRNTLNTVLAKDENTDTHDSSE
ncbi:MAG: hypothetical protein ACP5N7_04335 [Candidatus Pacearchaeota archaeon]